MAGQVVLKTYRANKNGGFPEFDNPAFERENSNRAPTTSVVISPKENLGAVNAYIEPSERVLLEWKHLTYTVKEKNENKHILNNVTGAAHPGTLTAIMGPSGAGKTTLLNILTGHYEKGFDGRVIVNNRLRHIQIFNRQSCYVMQESYLLPYLTVQEALMVTADLRLDSSVTKNDKLMQISLIMQDWGLLHASNTRSGNLSGGEKRRLAIALELMGNPPVIFLDEPTSGLDVASSLRCVKTLRKLANSGHTVLCSIHQPSTKIFNEFDQIHMLSRGRIIYSGLENNMVTFLRDFGFHNPVYYNPADFITEIANGDTGEYDIQPLLAHFDIKEDDSIPKETPLSLEERKAIENKFPYPSSFLKQFWILFVRCLKGIIRNKVAIPLRVACCLLLGLTLGGLYYDTSNYSDNMLKNTLVLLYMSMLVFFMSMMPTVIIFPLEICVFLREHRNCWYSPLVYYLAKVFSDAPIQAIPGVGTAVIIYFMVSHPLEMSRILKYILITTQSALVCQALGVLVSTGSSLETAVFLAPVSIAPFLMFGGFFVSESVIPTGLKWLIKTSFAYYAYQGLIAAVYGFDRQVECPSGSCVYSSPKELLETLEISEENWWLNSLGLLICDVVIRILAYILLIWRLRRKV